MFIEFPEIPTADKVRNMTDSDYKDLCRSFSNFCWEVVGAMATLKCDLFELRYSNKEVKERVDAIISGYEQDLDKAQKVVVWMMKVRLCGYKGEFQK